LYAAVTVYAVLDFKSALDECTRITVENYSMTIANNLYRKTTKFITLHIYIKSTCVLYYNVNSPEIIILLYETNVQFYNALTNNSSICMKTATTRAGVYIQFIY